MNRITISLICFILLFLVLSKSILSQNYHLIDLNKPSNETPSINYYVLDVLDSRKLQSSIGISKSGDKQEIIMLNFATGFHDELFNYFNNYYPAGEGKIPIILNMKKLWVTEVEEEGSNYSRYEIDIEFLTPKNQKFHECSIKNEIKLSNDLNLHKDNLIFSLNDCMQNLEGEEIKQTYYAVLSSNTPATISYEEAISQDVYVEGSEVQVVSKTSKARIALNGGYTYRLGRIPDGIDEEVEQYYKI